MISESLIEEIVAWMRRQTERREAAGALVGLSGGIDSATTAGLVKKAFGDNALGVLLPSSGTINDDVRYGHLTAETFGLKTVEVNIESIYNAFAGAFDGLDIPTVERKFWPQTSVPTSNPEYQNVSVRLRMMALYHIAEKMNYVVMGTSNKSEIITGYYTIYGDAGTDMRPLGDFYKTEVREVAKKIGVPQEIIDRPSSGGCRGEEDDLDEYEFGVDYETLDKIHMAMMQGEKLDRYPAPLVERVHELVSAARNKAEVPVFIRDAGNKGAAAVS